MFRLILGGLEDINVVIYTFLCPTTPERDAWLKHFSCIPFTIVHTNCSVTRELLKKILPTRKTF